MPSFNYCNHDNNNEHSLWSLTCHLLSQLDPQSSVKSVISSVVKLNPQSTNHHHITLRVFLIFLITVASASSRSRINARLNSSSNFSSNPSKYGCFNNSLHVLLSSGSYLKHFRSNDNACGSILPLPPLIPVWFGGGVLLLRLLELDETVLKRFSSGSIFLMVGSLMPV